MSNILAAIGRGQLQVIDDRVKRKHEIFDFYYQKLGDLPGIEFMPEAFYSKSNRWLTVILVNPEKFGGDREKIRLALEADNIESRPVWKPMHLQPVFNCSSDRKPNGRSEIKAEKVLKNRKRQYRARIVGGRVAEKLFETGLCLPSGTSLDQTDLNRIISIIRKCRK